MKVRVSGVILREKMKRKRNDRYGAGAVVWETGGRLEKKTSET